MDKFYLIFKKYFSWLLLTLMVFILLYPKFPLINVRGTYVAIRLEDFLIATTALIWLLGNFPNLKTLLRQTIYQTFVLFWLVGLLSFVSGYFITHSLDPFLGILHLLRRVEYMSLFIMAATTINSTQQLKLIMKVGLIVTAIIILYGFGQQWLKFPVISTTNREFSKGLILFLSPEARVNSTFAGHYDLAAFLTIFLVMLSSLFFVYQPTIRYRKFVQTILIVTGGLGFILLGMTAARVSFVATLIGLTLSFWLNKKKSLIVGLIFVSLLSLAAIPELRHRLVATLTVNFLGGGGPKYNPPANTTINPNTRLSLADRQKILDEATKSSKEKISTVSSDIAPGEPINSTELGVERSYGIRLDVEWPRALRGFFKNPLLGTGYSSLNIATDNDLLRSLGEVGLLGTLFLILIFLILFKKIADFFKHSQALDRFFIVGVFCSLIAVLITGTFIDVLEASKLATTLWFILGVAWAVMNNYHSKEN